jgi:hypothetical protein
MVENKVLEEFLDLDDKQLALLIVNYYQEIKGIRNDMVGDLNLLDKVVEGDEHSKELLRKSILDNYNELPRETLSFLEELIQKLKE